MASDDDERRSTLPTSTGVVRRRETERSRTGFDALPNDIIVSIFERLLEEPGETAQPVSWWEQWWYLRSVERRRSDDRHWLRETFPLVCRSWRDLYRSQQASPLHETLYIDSGWPEASRRLRPDGVIAWARVHARDVRKLRVNGENYFEITSGELGTVVEILAPSLTAIEVAVYEYGTALLEEAPFWDALREHVAPRGQLRKLAVYEVVVELVEGDALAAAAASDDDDEHDDDDVVVVDVSFLGQLTSLEELQLDALRDYEAGLRAFPASVLSLTRLRRLSLCGHDGIEPLPAGISTLRGLEDLTLTCSGLRSLPEELGTLTRLTKLDVGDNDRLGHPARDVAFPDALRGLKSLRHLVLSGCGLRAVPAFIVELQALEHLDLGENEGLGDGSWVPFAEPSPLTYLDLSRCSLTSVPAAVLSSMPRLQILDLHSNSLTSLPDNLGQRLPELREIDLSYNRFATVAPLRTLVGASSLEKIGFDPRCESDLQVEEPLDFLLENFPRLREMRMKKYPGWWTFASRLHLERFAERLKERDPAAVVEFQ